MLPKRVAFLTLIVFLALEINLSRNFLVEQYIHKASNPKSFLESLSDKDAKEYWDIYHQIKQKLASEFGDDNALFKDVVRGANGEILKLDGYIPPDLNEQVSPPTYLADASFTPLVVPSVKTATAGTGGQISSPGTSAQPSSTTSQLNPATADLAVSNDTGTQVSPPEPLPTPEPTPVPIRRITPRRINPAPVQTAPPAQIETRLEQKSETRREKQESHQEHKEEHKKSKA